MGVMTGDADELATSSTRRTPILFTSELAVWFARISIAELDAQKDKQAGCALDRRERTIAERCH